MMWNASRAHAVADDLGQNRRAAASARVPVLPEPECPRLRRPRIRRGRDPTAGRRAPDRHCAAKAPAWRANPPIPMRRDAGFRAAADHHVRVAVLDHPEGIADRMRAGGAGRGRGRIRPLRAGADRNVARSQVDDGRRNEKRRDAPRPFFEQDLVLALDHFESADAAADVNAGALGLFRIHLEARSLAARIPPPRWRTG